MASLHVYGLYLPPTMSLAHVHRHMMDYHASYGLHGPWHRWHGRPVHGGTDWYMGPIQPIGPDPTEVGESVDVFDFWPRLAGVFSSLKTSLSHLAHEDMPIGP